MTKSDKTKIYVADDNRDVLEIIRISFGEDHPYHFRYYSDALLFLEDLDRDLDLVILDVHMPNFDVVEAVKVIDEKSPRAYIIILSADRVWDTMKQLANLGIFRYCEKGSNFIEELKEAVAAAHRKITLIKKVCPW